MKKLLLSAIFALVAMSAYSQHPYQQEHDPWVGDWTSESYTDVDWEAVNNDPGSDILYKTQYKKVFRITKTQNGYQVRGKTIKVKDPDYTGYHPSYTVTKVEGNTIWMQSFVSKLPFYVNDRIDSYSDNTSYHKLTLNNGIIHYSFLYMHSVEYDRNMRYKGEEDLNFFGDDTELDLYNDNW